MTNIMKMVKQAQQMQAKMAKMEEELAKEEFEVAAGGGAVTVRMNGKQEIIKLTISEDAMKDGDREMLQELIMAAVNQAHQKASDLAKERIASITGGINIPGLF
ncbi:MAG TPA: YbaB/EbfC family nucleoid-associated protein [Candidatus Krumholzibacteria bacterium]|jgi:DNA-binding YbaB/EbfC family protein|nr:YbaB/EbfC family nucleoid-associated protein [Candidatus Krumholzibacteria bacterium]